MDLPFDDRAAAGSELARAVAALGLDDPVVLALPRGGVPVALPVAQALHAPLDLLMVRKIGAPGQPELAVAAVSDGPPPDLVIDEENCRWTGARRADIEAESQHQLREIARRRALYLGRREPVAVAGRDVVVVDDGIATGTTMRAALNVVRRRRPRRLVLAVPVAPADTLRALRAAVDDLVCLAQPSPFHAVGLHYRDFRQVEDEEVIRDLAAALAGA